MKGQRVLGVTGWKNSGKTTLVERLVATLTARGFRISTVKHAHHAFDIDHAGTDSARHRAAGATEVAVVSSTRWALVHELRDEEEPPLADILARLSPCDLVIVEGYKRDRHPKIEARRAEARDTAPLAPGDPTIVAIASDMPAAEAGRLPVFDIDDIEAIARFAESFMELPGQ